MELPKNIDKILPNVTKGRDDSLVISYADFLCPSDCPEPENFCTVTKKPREVPLYEKLRQVKYKDYVVHIIQSRQLTPGLGGYKVKDLSNLLWRVKKKGSSKWIIGTACKCHGILSALKLL